MPKRTDENQKYVVDGLRAIGATVQDLHEVGRGCPDILVGYHGRNYLIEIKRQGNGLNARENAWHKTWTGQVAVVWTLEQAIDVITAEDE